MIPRWFVLWVEYPERAVITMQHIRGSPNLPKTGDLREIFCNLFWVWNIPQQVKLTERFYWSR